MKEAYFSELLNKFSTDKKVLQKEEADYQEKQEKAAEEKAMAEQTKKELAKAITAAEDNVAIAYENLQKAKEKAAEILEKSNAEVQKILDDAKTELFDAEDAKREAIEAFNRKYGPYTVTYTGEKAKKETERLFDIFDHIFDAFWF